MPVLSGAFEPREVFSLFSPYELSLSADHFSGASNTALS
jgi:hypothetical protein